MSLTTLRDIERTIDVLPPQEIAELYAWLEMRRAGNRAIRIFFLNI
jgi:hypothetical protein